MKKPPCDKNRFAKFQAAQRLHESIRQDRARDALLREEGERMRARADRRAVRFAGIVKTAQARIDACRNFPTPLTVHQMRALVDNPDMPAHIRVQAATLILEWSC